MATSRRRPFRQACVTLAWGAWAELGVSGWRRTHADWAVDPEPLVLFTAWLGDEDARLRDEAMDWCIRYSKRLSRVRLKNLVKAQPAEAGRRFADFAATVSRFTAVDWPSAEDGRADPAYRPTERSVLRDLAEPSMGWLRLRAVFGLGAKAEVLRFFLTREDDVATVAELAAFAGYAKRVVADECDALRQAGVLRSRFRGNRLVYSAVHPERLAGFVGEPAPIRPDWSAVLHVARALADLEAVAADASPRVLAVEARRAMTAIEEDLDAVDADPVPESVVGPDLWPAAQAVAGDTLLRWAKGGWTLS